MSCLIAILPFYTLFEAFSIPIVLFVGLHGIGIRRSFAISLMLIVMLVGSSIFILNLIIWFGITGDFMVATDIHVSLSSFSLISTVGLCVMLLVKIPIMPLFIWLVEAHVESNSDCSILLACVILKLGSYGLMRFEQLLCGLFSMSWFIVIVSASTCIVASVFGLMTTDSKKLIAYSSIIHMNYSLVGVISNDFLGSSGFMLSVFSHGLVSMLLFYYIGQSYEQTGVKYIGYLNASMLWCPSLSYLSLCAYLTNIGFPLSINFIAEWLLVTVYIEIGVVLQWMSFICGSTIICVFTFSIITRTYMLDNQYFTNGLIDVSLLETWITALALLNLCVIAVL